MSFLGYFVNYGPIVLARYRDNSARHRKSEKEEDEERAKVTSLREALLLMIARLVREKDVAASQEQLPGLCRNSRERRKI